MPTQHEVRVAVSVLAALGVSTAACGHPTDSAPPAPTPPPVAAAPPAPSPAPTGAVGAGDARSVLLAALVRGRSRKLRMRVEMTSTLRPGQPPRTYSMVVEAAPPDRQRMLMQVSPTLQTETVRIGTRAWMRLGARARWTAAPPVSVAVGTAAAENTIAESARLIETGVLSVERLPDEGGLAVYRLSGTAPERGVVDSRITLGADGLPTRYTASTTQRDGATSQVTGTIEYDDAITIDEPTL